MNTKRFKDKEFLKIFMYYGLSRLLSPLDLIISLLVKKNIEGIEEYIHPPIFIIGLPRSGTTLLYQYLSIVLDVSYTNNLWAIFPRSAPYIRKIISTVPPIEFKSYYGNGFHLFSNQEGGTIFSQWFPDQNKHYYDKITKESKESLYKYFLNISLNAKKPCLIKNSRNVVRLAVLKDVFRNAYFIHLRRSPFEIAQSMILGRENLKGNRNKNFTVKPKEWDKISKLAYLEQIAQQVYLIDRQINHELETVPSSRKIKIDYPLFCNSPFEIAQKICGKFIVLHFRENIPDSLMSKQFNASRKKLIDNDSIEGLKYELFKLYGNLYDKP